MLSSVNSPVELANQTNIDTQSFTNSFESVLLGVMRISRSPPFLLLRICMTKFLKSPPPLMHQCKRKYNYFKLNPKWQPLQLQYLIPKMVFLLEIRRLDEVCHTEPDPLIFLIFPDAHLADKPHHILFSTKFYYF